ncbi:MAG: hypothetical protein AMXMBFR13_42080 [Phycisphaerae bacterium]
MHWFWRAAIAVAAGCAYSGSAVTFLSKAHGAMADRVTSALGATGNWGAALGVAVGYFLPVLLLAFGVYGLTTRLCFRRTLDQETRCRQCGYILRGISEPRCPECGERI